MRGPPPDVAGEGVARDGNARLLPGPGGEERAPLLAGPVGVAVGPLGVGVGSDLGGHRVGDSRRLRELRFGRGGREAVRPRLGVEQPVARSLVVADDGRDLRRRRVQRETPEGLGVAVGENDAVRRGDEVAASVGRGHHAHDRVGQVGAAGRAVEAGVAEGEDAAVGADQPVALPVARRRHADDRRVEAQAARAAVEASVAVGEDATVGRDEPVALAVGRRGHADDGLVEVRRAHRPVELGVAVREDAAVERAEPVPLGVRVVAMATIGPWSGSAPADPSKVASPKANTPPSALASRYPPPSGVATPEKTGELSGWGICGLVRLTLPNPIIPPSW